jgi:nucleoside 2-deoxyribosyltransferase
MLFYLGTPYRADPANNYLRVNQIAAELLVKGIKVFSPISHSHPIGELLPQEVNSSHSFWMSVDEPFMWLCDGLIVVQAPGWESSRGLAEEIGHFKGQGKPIVYYAPTDDISLLIAKLAASALD